MRTRTVTERVGEYLGPLDFGVALPSGMPPISDEQRRLMSEAQAEPEAYLIGSTHSHAEFPVCWVGMYDGWPYWAPAPAVGYIGPLGMVEITWGYNVRSLCKAPNRTGAA